MKHSKKKVGRKRLGRKATNITLPPDIKKIGMRAAFNADLTFGEYVANLIRENCQAEELTSSATNK